MSVNKTSLHEWACFHQSDKGKHHHYCDFYEDRIGEPRTILEFGILNGASLKMWRDRYPHALVVGMDIEEKEQIPGVFVRKGDCTKAQIIGRWDLIIDDASHNTLDQVRTFELWWPAINKGGHYIIEDIHTVWFVSYNPTDFNLFSWIEGLGIKYEIFWRDPKNTNDSGTVIFYK